MLDVSIATRCERGRRESNEDDLRIGRAGSAWYAVLADGAGGHDSGAEASRRAVFHLEAALCAAAPAFTAQLLTQAVLTAHAEVQRGHDAAEGAQRMHSTVVVLWIDSMTDRALWSHVGDSRLYRLRHGTVDFISTDDSVVQRMVEAGLLTPQQAQHHPKKNQLIAALGIHDEVEPHTLPQPVELEDGDAYLLCSDGWWDTLDEACMASTLSDAATPDEWLDFMQQHIEARALPRQDNFSAIAVWIGDPSETTRIMSDGEDTVP